MRKILNRGTFHEACPRCGLTLIDYLVYPRRVPCAACRNGKRKPGEGNLYSCEGGDHGPRF